MDQGQLTICDKCGGDAAFKQEISDKVSNWMCWSCGFQTNSLMRVGEEFYEKQKEILPNIYVDLMYEDKEGKVWFPSTYNIPEVGMVFVNGVDVETWKWGAVKAVPITKKEKKKFPIPGKKNQFYTHKTDIKSLKMFEREDFIEAMDFIGVFNENLET